MSTTAILCAAGAGLALGPLVRAAVWRHADTDPPRTTCPNCAHPARWAATRSYSGRCPACRTHTGAAPRLPEALTTAGFALAAHTGGPLLQTLALCWLIAFGTALALVDAAVHRLPDALTAPCFAGTAALLTAAALQHGDTTAIVRIWAGTAILGAGYLAFALIAPMGLGDVKLAPSLGAALGYRSWHDLGYGTFAAFLLGALYGAARLLLHKSDRKSHMPFGPFMILGAVTILATSR